MNLAIQTNLLPGDSLEAKFDAAARYGFDGVEINVGPNFDLDRNLSATRSAMTSSGLPVSGICTHPIHDPFHADPGERQTRFERLADLVGLAGELGAAGVVSVPVRPPVSFSGEMHLRRSGDRHVQRMGDSPARGQRRRISRTAQPL